MSSSKAQVGRSVCGIVLSLAAALTLLNLLYSFMPELDPYVLS